MQRLLAPALLVVATCAAPAERFLSVEEARRLCFPTATAFREQVVRFTALQRKAIQTRAGVPVLNLGNRCHVAFDGTNCLGILVLDHALGKHELIDYAVALSPDGTVLQLEILEYRESHGMEIRGDAWRGQFSGKTSTSTLRVHDDIYNLSGATISCRHVTQALKRVLVSYELVVRPRLHQLGWLHLPVEPASP